MSHSSTGANREWKKFCLVDKQELSDLRSNINAQKITTTLNGTPPVGASVLSPELVRLVSLKKQMDDTLGDNSLSADQKLALTEELRNRFEHLSELLGLNQSSAIGTLTPEKHAAVDGLPVRKRTIRLRPNNALRQHKRATVHGARNLPHGAHDDDDDDGNDYTDVSDDDAKHGYADDAAPFKPRPFKLPDPAKPPPPLGDVPGLGEEGEDAEADNKVHIGLSNIYDRLSNNMGIAQSKKLKKIIVNINNSPDILSFDPLDNAIIYRGEKINGSKFDNCMEFLFSQQPLHESEQFKNDPATEAFFKGLSQLGLSSSLITNVNAVRQWLKIAKGKSPVGTRARKEQKGKGILTHPLVKAVFPILQLYRS